jgi:branched-chain amino acid aminotransferase
MIETLPISVRLIEKSRINEVDFNDLKFGKYFADHMFIANYANGQWQSPSEILPYGNLSFPPSMAVFHYGQAIFEGQKAYRMADGSVGIFRPLANFARLNKSAERMCMPTVPEEIFMGGLLQLLNIDKNWVPSSEGSSLYIRPFLISTDDFLGVRPSETYKFMIINCPVGKYYSEPIRVKIERKYSRAADGGIGSAKAAGNYAASLYPAKLAQQKGYHQLLWTDPKEHAYFEESGTMNVMFYVDGVLLTPALSNTILAGITRDSIITLAKDMGIKVEERRISVEEIVEAHKAGKLQEAFGVGTAATVAPMASITLDDTEMILPSKGESGTLAHTLLKTISDIRYGLSPDKYNWMLKI